MEATSNEQSVESTPAVHARVVLHHFSGLWIIIAEFNLIKGGKPDLKIVAYDRNWFPDFAFKYIFH